MLGYSQKMIEIEASIKEGKFTRYVAYIFHNLSKMLLRLIHFT